MKKRYAPFVTGLLALILLPCADAGPANAQDEQVGTSTADLPSYQAKLSITNKSDKTLTYQLKWGNGEWKSYPLAPGNTRSHWTSINNQNRYAIPHITFNSINTSGSTWTGVKKYKLHAYKVGYSGFGTKKNLTTPKKYEFTSSTVRGQTTVDLVSIN